MACFRSESRSEVLVIGKSRAFWYNECVTGDVYLSLWVSRAYIVLRVSARRFRGSNVA